MTALFPEIPAAVTLHAFSGSLPQGHYVRCDMNQLAEYPCRVEDLPARIPTRSFQLIYADPPYSADDATKYGTPMVNRRVVLGALAKVIQPGGYLVWLDTCWPMHRKAEWRTAGRIAIVRSTNHRVRIATIFERQPIS